MFKNSRLLFPVLLIATLLGLTLITGCSSSQKDAAVSPSESSSTSTAEASASAAVGYRYWGYSQSSDDGKSWVTAMQGPATTVPKDGSVEGWNYTFSAEGVVDPTSPSVAPNFEQLCGATKATTGEKRVGFVIEFGDPVIYPEGDSAPSASSGCVSITTAATGLDILNKAAQVRAGDGGFICGLNGFPSKDCGADAIPVPESLRKK